MLLSVTLTLLLPGLIRPREVHAADWEKAHDGESRYQSVMDLIRKKEAQSRALEEVFRGRGQSLYIFTVAGRAALGHWYFTKDVVDYYVDVDVKYDRSALDAFYKDLSARSEFKYGDVKVRIKFPSGTLDLLIFYEHLKTYDRLIEDGYRFSVNAAVLDKDQTVLEASDNVLNTGTAMSQSSSQARFGAGHDLDFTGSPYLLSFEQASLPEITSLLEGLDKTSVKGKQALSLSKFLKRDIWVQVPRKELLFRNFDVGKLKRMRMIRVLKDSDELILYKADK
jgi:hypothetical protein